jgi:cytochrome c-type biogenesis protein CcsB
LAQASNVLIYSAMFVYTLALLAFVIDLSGRGRVKTELESGETASVENPAKNSAEKGGTVAVKARPGTSSLPARSKPLGIAISLTWLAFLVHLAGVVTRGLSVERAPWANMYEFSISGSVVVTAVYLAVLLRRDLRFLGTFVIGPVLLTLGLATTVLYTQASQLVPALQSYWLLIHVSVAFIASAIYTLAFSLTILQLIQERREADVRDEKPWRVGSFMSGLPDSRRLEHIATRLHTIAFPLWTFTVIAGAIWAEGAWGKYWNWDPKEVWSFVIWVVYAAHLHAKATRGWSGRAAARIALLGYGCILFNFLVVNIFFKGMHSYSGL